MKNLVERHGTDWVKTFNADRIFDRSREDYFHPFIKHRKVLHVGCTDWPFYPEKNLHCSLYGHKELHGLDIDEQGIEVLRHKTHGSYFTDIKHIRQTYDVILIPETIEHISNPGYFLEEIDQIDCTTLIVTVPDVALHYVNDHYQYDEFNRKYFEAIHDDHVAWYSPYTIKNLIQRNTSYEIYKVDMLHRSVVVHGRKQVDKKIRKTANRDWGTIFLK